MSMNQIHLMGVKEPEIKKAIGPDFIKVIKGTREGFNAFHQKKRRGLIKDSSSEDEAPTKEFPFWRCSGVACGGFDPKPNYKKLKQTVSVAQTADIDLTHYYDTAEILAQNNLVILTGRARDIQDGVVRRPRTNSGGSLEIIHRGSATSTGSQTNLRRPGGGPKLSRKGKVAKYFRDCIASYRGFFSGIVSDPSLLAVETSSDESADMTQHDLGEIDDHEWLRPSPPESNQDDMLAANERYDLEHPP
jgi:hypothetical protein